MRTHTHTHTHTHALGCFSVLQECSLVTETPGPDLLMSLYNMVVIGSYLKGPWWEKEQRRHEKVKKDYKKNPAIVMLQVCGSRDPSSIKFLDWIFSHKELQPTDKRPTAYCSGSQRKLLVSHDHLCAVLDVFHPDKKRIQCTESSVHWLRALSFHCDCVLLVSFTASSYCMCLIDF